MIHKFAIRGDSDSIVAPSSANVDAFSRIRVSEAQTLFEVQCQYNSEALRMESGNTGAGVAPAHSANTRLVTLQVNAGGAGGTSFMQSFQYIPYQPGKSHFIAMTGVMGAGTAGAVKRFGYGDSLNGIFYEQNGIGGLQVNRRTSTSGATVNNTVTQANWNLDRMDGTGPSGVTLDPTACFILIIDLQYLGMGRVRIGFDVGGVIFYVHEFLNANILTVPYMQTATLPVMTEVVAAAALASPAVAYFKCAQVASEAGFDIDVGRDFAAEGTVTAASGARTHILSLRPLATFNGITNRGFIVPETIDLLAGTNPVLWELVIGAAFTVAPTFASVNGTYSFVEAGTAGTFANLTNGVVIAKGYVSLSAKDARNADTRDLAISYPLTLDRAGAVRALGTLSLLVTGIGGTSDTRASLGWREIR
jgi:hypothetical protein